MILGDRGFTILIACLIGYIVVSGITAVLSLKFNPHPEDSFDPFWHTFVGFIWPVLILIGPVFLVVKWFSYLERQTNGQNV